VATFAWLRRGKQVASLRSASPSPAERDSARQAGPQAGDRGRRMERGWRG